MFMCLFLFFVSCLKKKAIQVVDIAEVCNLNFESLVDLEPTKTHCYKVQFFIVNFIYLFTPIMNRMVQILTTRIKEDFLTFQKKKRTGQGAC